MAGERAGAKRATGRRRLSRSAEFERVYRQGRSKSNRHLVLYVFPRAGEDPAAADDGPRPGISV
jgi:ribonuclease P protein component